MEKYIKLDVLGNCTNGSVTLVKNLEDNQLYARKKLYIDSKNEKENVLIQNEVCILINKNVIQIY